MRLRHPDLGRSIEIPDDRDTIAVHQEAGWVEVHLVQDNAALAPAEATDEPPKPRRGPKPKPGAGRGDQTAD